MAMAQLPEDIIKTHILTRLDGQTLVAAGCTSSQLHSLSSHRKLWSDICSANWPSTDDPIVRRAVANFPSGHRSFFSDSFPSPSHRLTPTNSPATSHLISSVDLHYLDEIVFSNVKSTEINSNDWFKTSPFRIDLLEPKEIVSSTVKFAGDDEFLKSNLEKNLSLSWIVIDPTRNRAVNISSERPVSAQRNWLTGEVEVRFAVVMAVDGGDYECVNCNTEVTFGGKMNVTGVSLTIQDIDGKCLNGKDSIVILQGALEGERIRGGENERERYEEYVEKKRERKEWRERRERRLDMVFIAFGIVIFVAFWSFIFC